MNQSIPLDELYQDVILTHAKSPHNFGSLDESAIKVSLHNPLCGDQIELYASISDNVVHDLRFSGHGCSISRAASSILTDLCKGKTVEEAQIVVKKYHQLLTGEADESIRDSLGDLSVLEGVKKFPTRIRCATLAAEAISTALKRATCADGQ